jgi:hypothetical protein
MSIIRKIPLIIEYISDTEIMLYDKENNRTHLLNSSASTFLRAMRRNII